MKTYSSIKKGQIHSVNEAKDLLENASHNETMQMLIHLKSTEEIKECVLWSIMKLSPEGIDGFVEKFQSV